MSEARCRNFIFGGEGRTIIADSHYVEGAKFPKTTAQTVELDMGAAILAFLTEINPIDVYAIVGNTFGRETKVYYRG